MESLLVTQAQYDEFIALQVKYRRDCDAAFSSNEDEQIWLFVTRKQTPKDARIYVHGESVLLDRIGAIFSNRRESGGRFLIKTDGAHFWNSAMGGWARFVEFRSTNPLIGRKDGREKQEIAPCYPDMKTLWAQIHENRRFKVSER